MSRSRWRGPGQDGGTQHFVQPYLEMLHWMHCPRQVKFSIPGLSFGVQQITLDLSLNLGQAGYTSILLMPVFVCTTAKTDQSIWAAQANSWHFYPAGCVGSVE